MASPETMVGQFGGGWRGQIMVFIEMYHWDLSVDEGLMTELLKIYKYY